MASLVTQALKEWEASQSDLSPCSEACCFEPHFDRYTGRALPDVMVCRRERLWRRYVRIRDSNPDFPYKEISYEETIRHQKIVTQ